jgi:hypothetical protein
VPITGRVHLIGRAVTEADVAERVEVEGQVEWQRCEERQALLDEAFGDPVTRLQAVGLGIADLGFGACP